MTAPDQTTPSPSHGPGLAGLLGRLPLPLRIGIPVLVLAAIAVGVFVVQRQNSSGGDSSGLGLNDSRTLEKGQPAPDFTLAGLDGQPVKLSSLRGKPVVLNFWATWCGPCRDEMPDLQAKYDAAGGAFVLLGINYEGTAPDTAKRLAGDFRDELNLTFPIVLDSPDGAVFNRYVVGGKQGLPDTFFIDKDGVVRDVVIGPLSRKAFDDKLKALLAQ